MNVTVGTALVSSLMANHSHILSFFDLVVGAAGLEIGISWLNRAVRRNRWWNLLSPKSQQPTDKSARRRESIRLMDVLDGSGGAEASGIGEFLWHPSVLESLLNTRVL